MPAATRLGDISTGHGAFPPRPNDQGSPNVFDNGIALHRQGDHWVTHCNPIPSCHDGFLSAGSPAVYANSKQAGRIGDPISCGDTVATGSSNVFIGNGGGGTGIGGHTWGTNTNTWGSETRTWGSI